MTKQELKDRLTDAIALLTVPGVGRMRYTRLVRAFGSPGAALAAPISQLVTVSGISRGIASDIRKSADPTKAAKTGRWTLMRRDQAAARVIQLGWEALFIEDDRYPAPLRRIPDAPPLIFRLGAGWSNEDKAIAIVGTRHATESGRRFTHGLAAALAREGIIVVSGMAEGIDSAAHQGALDAHGQTIAVWGSSLDIVFPSSNRQLAEKIVAQGAVYSEYLPGTHPDKATFPERNRIISGLADGVIVVEAGKKSGALITARFALEQGRELFAVPGSPGARMSEGANDLIKTGARLLTSVEDVFDELPRLKGEVVARKFSQLPDLTEMERSIVKHLSTEPRQVDKVARGAGMAVEELLGYLLTLELKGLVVEMSGKRFALTENYE